MEVRDLIWFQLRGAILIRVTDYLDVDSEVRIHFTDGQFIEGVIDSVEDEEESELGEMGLSVFTRDGGYVGIGESEIERIELID